MNKTEKLIKQAKQHIWLANGYLNEDGGEMTMVIKHLDMAKGCIEKLLYLFLPQELSTKTK